MADEADLTSADPPARSISVVVTNHDYERFLAAAVDSALAIQGAEVVVVDDGSTDGSRALLDTYGDRITTVLLDGVGQGGAMNAGFAASTGELVWFLDADDRVDAAAVPAIQAAFARAGVVRVHFPLRRIDADGRPSGTLVPDEPEALPAGDLAELVLRHPHDLLWQPTTGNVYLRRMLARAMPMPADAYRICADHYLNGVSALHGSIAVVDRPGGEYRVHGANADARTEFDLDKVQGLVARAQITDEVLAVAARELGRDADVGPSVTQAANRLISLRLAPNGHPLADDSVRRAARDGLRAAIRRRDLSPLRRSLAAGFVAALAVTPKRTIAPLASRFLQGATDSRPSTFDRWSTAA